MPLVRVSNGGSSEIAAVNKLETNNKNAFTVKTGNIYLIRMTSNSQNYTPTFTGASHTRYDVGIEARQDGAGWHRYIYILQALEDGTIQAGVPYIPFIYDSVWEIAFS